MPEINRDAELDSQTVFALARRQQMREAEDEERNDDGQTNQNVDDEHLQGELVGIGALTEPFEYVDGQQINAGDAENRRGGEDDKQKDFQARPDGRLIDSAAHIQ